MDSEDEAFNNFIEVEDGAASDCEDFEEHRDIENSTNIAKSKPTTKAQIDKIIAFVEEYNDQLIEKSVYDSLWNTLTEDLNNLGPPTHTNDKWKRVWSQYKYRNKKLLADLFRSKSPDEPFHSNSRRKRSTDQLSIQTENCLSSQMTKLSEQQDNIIRALASQRAIINRCCHLLEEISKKIN